MGRYLGDECGDPRGNLGPRIAEIEEQHLVQELVTHPAVEALDQWFAMMRPRRRQVVAALTCRPSRASGSRPWMIPRNSLVGAPDRRFP